MTGSLIALEWTALSGCIFMAAAVVAAFAASVAGELRRVPAAPSPGGPWYPRTDPAATAPLGPLPAAVEAELAKLAALIPDRPA